MAKSDALFSLIKSLTKSEKRYFKLNTRLQGQQKNYLVLFETLDQMDLYDERLVRSRLAGEPFIKQLHVTKNYLSKLILKSLRGFHANQSVSAKLKSYLLDIEILFKRDLLDYCFKTICQAEKLANRVEDSITGLQIMNWKRKVLLNMKGVGDSKQMHGIHVNEKKALKCIGDEIQYWSMTINAGNLNEDELSNYHKHPYLKDASMAKTRQAKILYYHLLYVTQTMSGNLIKAEKSIDQLIEYLESNSFQLLDDPSPYITALSNKIGLYLNTKQLDQIPQLLNKLRTIPEQLRLKNKSPISMKLMIRTYNVELETYRDSGQVSSGVKLIPKIRSFLEQNKGIVPREYKILFYYQFAYMYFMQKRFSNALRDVNTVLDYRYSTERIDIVGYAQFLNLIIHYELGNSTVLKYAVNASRRYLRKRGHLMEFEKVLLKLFSKISTRPENQHRSLFDNAYQQLFGSPALITESELDYLDFDYWLKSKGSDGNLNRGLTCLL